MRIRQRKTAGVRVTRAVYAHVSSGDAARNRGDKAAAIDAYRAALTADPSLAHIWVQLGHMLKDTGDLDSAIKAYDRATIGEGPASTDGLLQLGHVEKGRGRIVEAMRYFVRASQRDPTAFAPTLELADLLSTAVGKIEISSSAVIQLLAELRRDRPSPTKLVDHEGMSTIMLDCTSLVHSLAGATESREATRDLIRLLDLALAAAPDRVRLVYIDPSMGGWSELLEPEFRDMSAALADGAVSSDRGSYLLARLALASAMQDQLEFAQGSWLVELASLYELDDHQLAVRAVRNHDRVRCAAIFTDLLPIARPQFSSEVRRRAVVALCLELFNTADVLLAGSNEIARDLIRLATDAGVESIDDRIVVVPAAGVFASTTDHFRDLIAELDSKATSTWQPASRQAVSGRWHPFTPLNAVQVKPGIGTGTAFRSDAGWLPAVAVGCWTRPGGGEITIGLPTDGTWRLSLQLLGLPARGSRWSLDIEDRMPLSGSLDANVKQWIVIEDLEPRDGRLRLFVEGHTHDFMEGIYQDGRLWKMPGSVGVTGFHICHQDDWAARDELISTVVLSDLHMLSAYV